MNKTNIDADDVRSFTVIMTSSMNLGGGEAWTVLAGESTLGFIGPTQDLINEGTINIAGDVLFYADTKGIDNRGDINITAGSLQIKEA